MKKIRILVVLLGMMFASASQAQLVGGLVFGAVSTGINKLLGDSQKQVISAVKMTADIYVLEGSNGLVYLTSRDSTTQTSGWITDDVVMKIKPFYNRAPAKDLKFYVNDRLVAWRDVEGGKWNYSKKRIEGAQGVIGDYPYIQGSDLDMGFNQIKVRVSDKEWGSMEIIRLNIGEFLRLAQSEEIRSAIGGIGNSTYPVLQSYIARMPDGTLRNFASIEQMQLELGQIKPASASTSVRGSQDQPGGFPSGTNQSERQKLPLEVFAYQYSAEENRGIPADVQQDLAAKALQGGQVTGDTLAIPVDRGGLAILVHYGEPFKVQLKDAKGTLIKDFSVVKTETSQGPMHSCYVSLGIGAGDKATSKLVITVAGKTIKTIKFEKKK